MLVPPESVTGLYTAKRTLKTDSDSISVDSGALYSYYDVFQCYESFMITGRFNYTDSGSFGLCFDYSGRQDKYKMISLSPKNQTLSLSFNEGKTPITETAINIEPDRDYSFTYIQEGSVGVFYIDGAAALTVRIYGVSGRTIRLFAENNTVRFTELHQFTRP